MGIRMQQYTSREYRRGDIYYIENSGKKTGSEIMKDRPAIIVSNDANNKRSPVLEVVFLTSKPKADLPTHVTIRSTGRQSEALCEQPTPISVERIGNYVATATEQEMKNIDIALEIALSLNMSAEQVQRLEELLSAGAENPSGGY